MSTVTSWIDVATAVGCGACESGDKIADDQLLIVRTVVTPLQFSCMKAIPFQVLENVLTSESVSFAPVPDGMYVIKYPSDESQ